MIMMIITILAADDLLVIVLMSITQYRTVRSTEWTYLSDRTAAATACVCELTSQSGVPSRQRQVFSKQS
jgi:hypothetical protein